MCSSGCPRLVIIGNEASASRQHCSCVECFRRSLSLQGRKLNNPSPKSTFGEQEPLFTTRSLVPHIRFRNLIIGRHTVIVGDSVERYIYYALIRSLGFNTPMAHNASVERHTDLPWTSSDGSGTTISFLWAVKVDDLAKKVRFPYPPFTFPCGTVFHSFCSRKISLRREVLLAVGALLDR